MTVSSEEMMNYVSRFKVGFKCTTILDRVQA